MQEKKWAFVVYEYPNTCCPRRTRFGAWWHGATGHFMPGRVMRKSTWQARRTDGLLYEDPSKH